MGVLRGERPPVRGLEWGRTRSAIRMDAAGYFRDAGFVSIAVIRGNCKTISFSVIPLERGGAKMVHAF